MPQHSRALGFFVTAAAVVLLTGCVSTTSNTSRTTAVSRKTAPAEENPSPAVARAHSLTPDAGQESREDMLRRLYIQASSLRESAQASLTAGDPESAAVLYDEAMQRLQEANLQQDEDPQLMGLWETMVEEVRDLEVDALARAEDVGGEPHDTTPLQTLAELGEEAGSTEGSEEESPPEVAEAVVYDIPVVMNSSVQRILDYYTGPRHKVIARGLERSGAYVPFIQEILKEEGLPADLAWLPLIESNFKTTALSRAGAKGMWQFIPSTGRKYGLRIDWYVDERSDPVKATRAAAAYLKDLHAMFGDWYLALAAYNCGEGRVARSLRRTGKDDFWGLARARALPRETRGYVPAFLAGLLIGRDPAAHGFDIVGDRPWSFDVVEVEGPADLRVLARCAGTDVATLRTLNPELRRWVTTGGRPYALRVPAGSADGFAAKYAMVPLEQRLLYLEHRVRPGETVSKIARHYGTSVGAITAENRLRNPHRIGVGTVLRIPRSGSAPPSSSKGQVRSSSKPTSSPSAGGTVVHVVRRRETLTSIARRYNTTARQVASQNGLRSVHRIYPGQRLKISPGVRGTSSRSQAAKSQAILHTVRRGDTLYEIAQTYSTSVSALRRWNQIGGSRIWPGDVLRIYSN
jgi:membrane-bound lytic murein transglycosylase D